MPVKLLSAVMFAATLLLVTSLDLSAAAKKPMQKKQAKVESCSILYKKYYAKGDKHKSFATSGGRRMTAPKTSCGSAEGFGTKEAASKKALHMCNVMKKRFGASGKCKVIEAK